MRKLLVSFLLVFTILLLVITPVAAQAYYFQLPTLIVDAFWESDGTLSLDYTYNFINTSSGHVIDYLDFGLPNSNYSDSNISAFVNGNQVHDISSSGFQGLGSSGVAIALGQYAIQPGASGTVQVHAEKITGVLYQDTQDSNYVSADFAPAYFESKIVSGKTNLKVTFHLPPGVQTQEPRWHAAPDGFPSTPVSEKDSEGRIIYEWENANANAYTSYLFGASFPSSYVPSGVMVTTPPPSAPINFPTGAILPVICIGGFIAIVVAGLSSDSRRKQAYLPPKISIEGHGIKRGLTAVEAAILLEQPLDKVLTMILFSTIKKNAAEVTSRDPFALKVTQPISEDLQPYEKDFLNAFLATEADRKKKMRDMVVNLVKNVSEKMKGFSRQETIAYYADIIKRAWEQVEAADTPEVKSAKFEEVMDWTMLDKNYDGRTQDVFRNMPVFIPVWWGHYDPGFGKVSAQPAGMPIPSGGGRTSLPGADFAASMATGVQTFSSKVVGNVTEFTSSITNVTNPPPKPSSSSSRGGFGGGSGHSCVCACACACAGCACACAGGGR